jgi:hypothetical protein
MQPLTTLSYRDTVRGPQDSVDYRFHRLRPNQLSVVINQQSGDARHSELSGQVGKLGNFYHLGEDKRVFDGQLDRQPGDRWTETSVRRREDANVPGRAQGGEPCEGFLAEAGSPRRSKFDGLDKDRQLVAQGRADEVQ